MAMSTKGVYWSDKEIKIMLKALHRNRAGQCVMTSTNLESIDIFQAVSDRMAEMGFQQSV